MQVGEEVQLRVGSRRSDCRSLQVDEGGAASSREQEEGAQVTAGGGRSAASNREQEEGVKFTVGGGREHSFE